MTGTYALRRLAGAAVLPACIALSQACASPPSAAAHGKAVMIDFAVPTDGASPALLASLSHRAGATLVYRAAVSPNRHAYQLDCAATDPDCRQAIASLSADPRIRSISADRLSHPSQDNR